ncbi:MAG: NAD-dependent epimerase/dehydratase family protein [Bdellovibrionaceae bacterium]|nr:NAD-dependent epimerase/dehydratase family protein [Pseudobdellovibrionaceae bacterium]
MEDLNLIQEEARECFECLRGKNILITGATGLFGKWLVSSISHINSTGEYNIKLFLLSRNWSKFKKEFPYLADKPFIHLVEGDVRFVKLDSIAFDYTIHAATDVKPIRNFEDSMEILDSIILGTKNILSELVKGKSKRVLIVSSGAIYGINTTNKLVKESQLQSPSILRSNNCYAEGKRIQELLGSVYNEYGLLTVVNVRCFAVLGPYLPLNQGFAAGNFVSDSLSKKEIVVKSDGKDFRSYLYMADVVIWLLKLLVNGKGGEAYNMGSDKKISIAELANKISKFSPNKSKVIIQKKSNNRSPVMYVPNIEKAKADVGVKVYTELELAIKKTLRWFDGTQSK